MSCVWVLQRGNIGDGCDFVWTLCKYDLRKGDLFVLSWVRVSEAGSISSELLMCGGGLRITLLFPLVTRCQNTIHVCIWRMFVFMADIVTVWGSVGMFVVLLPLLKIVFFSLGVLKHVVCLCSGCDGCDGCDGCCVFCLYCDAWSCR